MKTLSSIIRNYLSDVNEELKKKLESKDIGTTITLKGEFSPVTEAKIYISLYDDDINSDEERFGCITFSTGFNYFEIHKEDVFEFIDLITKDCNIKENFIMHDYETGLELVK